MKLLAIGRPRLGVNVATAIPPLARLPLVANDLVEFEFIELRPFGAFDVAFPDQDGHMPVTQSPRHADNQERQTSNE